mmetsp:Transcript_55757/g.181052  ORF Transcript_55757/g.181052 Transcript_55757/m.181052 type:complete len:227 (+) Transcript_55757:40-720(+)
MTKHLQPPLQLGCSCPTSVGATSKELHTTHHTSKSATSPRPTAYAPSKGGRIHETQVRTTTRWSGSSACNSEARRRKRLMKSPRRVNAPRSRAHIAHRAGIRAFRAHGWLLSEWWPLCNRSLGLSLHGSLRQRKKVEGGAFLLHLLLLLVRHVRKSGGGTTSAGGCVQEASACFTTAAGDIDNRRTRHNRGLEWCLVLADIRHRAAAIGGFAARSGRCLGLEATWS